MDIKLDPVNTDLCDRMHRLYDEFMQERKRLGIQLVCEEFDNIEKAGGFVRSACIGAAMWFLDSLGVSGIKWEDLPALREVTKK